MKVYVLIEQVFTQCENPYSEILGVYKNKTDAEQEQEKIIKDNIENFNFVLDKEKYKHIKIIFCEFQENWDNYIEYKIIEKEVL